jgi:hypothetical protein
MDRAAGYIVNGLIALALALVLWKLTGSFVSWLALFLPGAALVIWGFIVMLRDY